MTLAWVAQAVAGAAIIAAAVGIVYGPAIRAPFIFDDHNSVLANRSILRLWPLVGNVEAPGPLAPPRQFCTAGRPLVNLSLAINYHFGQFDPAGYHLFNVAIHLGTTFLLWALVRRTLLLDRFRGRFTQVAGLLGFLTALVWTLHPMATETVEYVTQRTELMVGFFYLATLYASLRYWEAAAVTRRAAWLVIATLTCLGGMASKEVMVSAPVMVLLYERTFIAGSFRRAVAASWPLYLGMTLGWVLLLALNVGGPRSDSAGFHLGVPAYAWWFTQAKVLFIYLKLAAWPWPLVIHYDSDYLDTLRAAWPWALATLLLAVATIVLVARRTATGFVLSGLFAILAPTLLVPIVTEVAAERRMYLPLAALVPLFVVAAYQLGSRAVRRPAPALPASRSRSAIALVLAVALSVAGVFGVVSSRRLALYNDPLALWQDALAHQPDSSVVRVNLGMTLSSLGRAREAIPHLQHAARLKPDSAEVYNNLGLALIGSGRPGEAIPPIERALTIEPEFAEAHNNLAVALATVGRQEESIAHLERALQIRHDYVEARMNLGLAMVKAGRPRDAIEHLEHALRCRPAILEAYAPLIQAYTELDRAAEAIDTAERAVQLARSQGKGAEAAQIESWLKEHRAAAPRP